MTDGDRHQRHRMFALARWPDENPVTLVSVHVPLNPWLRSFILGRLAGSETLRYCER